MSLTSLEENGLRQMEEAAIVVPPEGKGFGAAVVGIGVW